MNALDLDYLVRMIESIRLVLTYVSGGRIEFFTNQMVQDAVIRRLEVLGEAAGKISVDGKQPAPDVPWQQAVRLRNVLIHDFVRVDLDRVAGG